MARMYDRKGNMLTFEIILDSLANGQFTQFKAQVRRYGKKRFINDIYSSELTCEQKLELIYEVVIKA